MQRLLFFFCSTPVVQDLSGFFLNKFDFAGGTLSIGL
jgi:hypothetical protein